MGSAAANQKCYEKLREKNVIVTLRDSHIRVSPNFYNTEEEIERFLELL
jgi:selenocysteine lyase/cysteine desulfurase